MCLDELQREVPLCKIANAIFYRLHEHDAMCSRSNMYRKVQCWVLGSGSIHWQSGNKFVRNSGSP